MFYNVHTYSPTQFEFIYTRVISCNFKGFSQIMQNSFKLILPLATMIYGGLWPRILFVISEMLWPLAITNCRTNRPDICVGVCLFLFVIVLLLQVLCNAVAVAPATITA